ncbi:MAG: hypothetical protein OXF79_21575 [Chloroflexi bacterium]|nr:hypothetical protein [Chloroflexota bacterium]
MIADDFLYCSVKYFLARQLAQDYLCLLVKSGIVQQQRTAQYSFSATSLSYGAAKLPITFFQLSDEMSYTKIPQALCYFRVKEVVRRMYIPPENVGHHARIGLLGQPAFFGARITVMHALAVNMIDKVDLLTEINRQVTFNQKMRRSITPVVPGAAPLPHGTPVLSRIIKAYFLVPRRIKLRQKKAKSGPTVILLRFHPVHFPF